MRTVCGWGRQVQRLVGRGRARSPVAAGRLPVGGRAPLLTDEVGRQIRGGVRLDQVDGTTCGSAVLVALAAWADPGEVARLDRPPGGPGILGGPTAGFGARYDARQKQVHRESTRFWPQSMGTTPWGMTAWLRRYAPGAGPYRVRLLDDTAAGDVTAAIAEVDTALAAGWPVPLLVGPFVPRHYCLALAAEGGDTEGGGTEGNTAGGVWRVYEPTSGEVRTVPVARIGSRTLAPLLGFDHLHAVLLPG